MFIAQGYSVRKILKFVKLASSTWYKSVNRFPDQKDKRKNNKGRPIPGYTVNPDGLVIFDHAIIQALIDLRGEPFFEKAGGYHKLTHYLERDHGYIVNHKKVYRLCSENGLLLPKKKKTKRRGKKICENRNVTGPNQLWQFDIKYGYIHGENRFFFLMVFIDTFNRNIMDYHLGLQCKGSDIIFTLNNALRKDDVDASNLVIRSDNGTQMTSHMFKNHTEALGLEHEFTPPSTPNLNAFVESFFSIVETELFQEHIFESYSKAYETTVKFIKHYHERRIHGSLNYKTPLEFKKEWTEENKKENSKLRA
jgi:putative transposase